ncbi:pyocin knob domain-containing protein, partial [Streptomyces sp. NPDC056309]
KAEADAKFETPTGSQSRADAAKEAAISWAKSFGLGDTCKDISGTDLNNLDFTGFFRGNNLIGSPSISNYYFVINLKWSKTVHFQIIFRNSATNFYETLFRLQTTTGWTAWEQWETVKGSQAKVDAHANKKDNPHSVTAAQVGAYTKTEADNKFETPAGAQSKADLVKTALDTHMNNKGNPHGVTAAQISVYTKAQADARYETPTGAQAKATAVQDWVKSFGLGDVMKSISGTDLNDLDATGFYVGNNLTNSPNTANYYFVIHLKWGNGVKYQILFRNSTNNFYESHIRYFGTPGWTSWSQLQTTETIKSNVIDKAQMFKLTQDNGYVLELESGTDIKTVTASGLYLGSNLVNMPNDGWYRIIIAASSSTSRSYIATRSDGRMWIATMNAGTWIDWKEIESTEGAQAKVEAHANLKNNPHGVTKSQVGLGNVDNVKQATKTEFDAHTGNKSNPHSVTAAQVGAYTKAEIDGKFNPTWTNL